MSLPRTRLEGPGGEVVIADDEPFVLIGERINPTGRRRLTEELIAGDMTTVRDDARRQVEAGARVLDLNAGIPGFDEPAMLAAVVRAVREVVDVPLCIDSSTPEALEAAVPLAEGKVLINSVTAEERSLERLLPLVARFGAAVIGMANDEQGISMDPERRLAAARRIVEAAADHGIDRADVIIDPLTMPVGAASDAATSLLATVRLVREELGVNVSCGASNVSFGMPARPEIDAAFLAIAIAAGMNAAIANPLHREVRKAVLATDVLLGRDPAGARWIADHRAEAAARGG
ncbi:MAG: methyltetrahydrofolate--corrinoid methyltransferase [Actinomycetota bacterium]|nr:MAG: methyltetrahydrofolate--corrinoid methyltransferase [Actinomycetota bacterium]